MVKLDVRLPIGYDKNDIKAAALRRLPIGEDEILDITPLRAALDLKDKKNIHYHLTLGVTLSEEKEAALLKLPKYFSPVPSLTLTIPTSRLASRPVVVGAGPCGIFAALTLAEAGARPIILERGLPVEARTARVESFSRLGILDTECNVQFGEGGAGTYSDGKLKVGSLDKYKMKVLREFILAGATEDIAYSATAHLGTDKLPGIVAALREKLLSLGADIIYSARFTSFSTKNGKISSVTYEKAGESVTIDTDTLILAIGHSAKDTFERLLAAGVVMQPKGFGIGLRIEHPREYINELVYGKGYDSRLETASYHLVTHLKGGRSVYSFCMCPGGTVVAAASETGGIVTNGMSEYLRNGRNSNSALLVSVTPDDFGSSHALAGMELQRKIERRAFTLAGSDYRAPATTLGAFLDASAPALPASPSYPRGVSAVSPDDYLPPFVSESLRASFTDFDEWMPGFLYRAAALTGPETRTTAPVRLLRTETYESCGLGRLFVAGEGAGYSGGIVSSAVDGVKCALAALGAERNFL